jgi:hypothetical protein
LTSSGNGAPGRNCTCVVPFRRRMPVVFSATGAKKWSRASVLPRVSPRPKRGGFAVSLARVHDRVVMENGGLCGHCSRDLPLDRRLLFIAELTGRKWCGVRVMLPTGQ